MEAAEVAAEFCERLILGNVETVDFKEAFPKQRFDVVTFGDVLEHLVDPLAVLIRVKDILNERGYIVASVPNIGHSSIRLALLKGRFDYTEKGLLDRTHLRFFTQESLADLFHVAGYDVRTWRRIVLDPFSTEVALQEGDYPAWLTQSARSDPQGIAYQFVIRAYPLTATTNGRAFSATPRDPGRNLIDGLWSWHNEVQEELALRDAALEDARRRLDDTSAKVAERDALIAQRDRSLQESQAQLAEISQSVGYRLLQAYRRRIRWLFPKDSQRGAPYRLLRAVAKRAAQARSDQKLGPTQPTNDESRGPARQR